MITTTRGKGLKMENAKFEEEIIKKFIVKDKQDRLLWEFSNLKKRDSVIWHFSGPKYFKHQCLHVTAYMSRDVMQKYLLQHTDSKVVYFIGESHIGFLSVEQAVTKAQTGEICILYCGNGIGYYQGEQENGSPPRFLLRHGGQGDGSKPLKK